MSNFTTPIQAHSLDSDTTVLSINDTGSILAGPAGAVGQVAMVAVLTCTNLTSGPSSIRLPANSLVTDMWLLCTVSGSGNSQGVSVKVGTSGDATKYGQVDATAQSRIYRSPVAPNATTASVAAWKIGSSNVQLHIDVTGKTTAAGAVDNFEAILSVQYVR